MRFSADENAALPFGKEWDVDDDPEYIVDSYMASRLTMDPTANFGVESVEDQKSDQ